MKLGKSEILSLLVFRRLG